MTQHDWRIVLEEFARLAALSMDNGNLADAMLLGYLGGTIASRRMTGYYAIPELERPFLAYAQHIPVSKSNNHGKGILHVMTEAYAVGGHTALVIQNIQKGFPGERCSVLLTRQKAEDAPDTLRAAMEKTGGSVFSLADTTFKCFFHELLFKTRYFWPHKKHERRAIRNAKRLLPWNTNAIEKTTARIHSIALEYERVILSTHMDDPWPLLGFGHTDFPRPVFTMNHADHLFWMGRSVTDAVLEFRQYGKDVSDRKRGRPHSLMLPILFEKTKPTTPEERMEIRRRFDLPTDKIIVVSVGSAYKYEPTGEWNYPRFVMDTLAELPEAVHLVIGPRRDDAVWRDAAAKAGDGLVMPGIVPHEQLEPWLRAADVYVGGFPLGGGFILHDAARIGLPALMTGTPAYYAGMKSEHDWVFSSVPNLREGLRRHIRTPGALQRLSLEQGDYFEQFHSFSAYQAAIEHIVDWDNGHKVSFNWNVDSTVEAIDIHFDHVLSKSVCSTATLCAALKMRLNELLSKGTRRAALRIVEKFDSSQI